ncbi:MAG: ASKHA domain-containing protein [Candidatus Odinarchaeota archaeon]
MTNERITLILEPISKRTNVKEGSTVYESLLALNFAMSALCGGKGTCGKCLIRVLDPNPKISEPTEQERKILGNQKISEGFRLACQTRILGDLRVFLTDSLISRGTRIMVDAGLETLGIKETDKFQPAISSQISKIIPADLTNPRDDLSGLFESIIENSNTYSIKEDQPTFHVNDILHSITQKLPHIMRADNGEVTSHFRKLSMEDNWTLYDVDAGDKSKQIFGLAVDIGTTTIVGYLIYLKTGEIVAISAILNPQVAIGEDVVSRITYIVKNDAIQKAKDLINSAINQIIEECCSKANISVSCLKDISIVGNTGMHHIFFGVSPQFLATSPFPPVFKAPINVSANKLGIQCNPNVNVYSPPVIAGYVGTDTIGCIISSKIYSYDKYTLLIDIGTNGELVIGNNKGLVTGSCAAGSALEGAHISHGMRGSEGAIESVTIDKDTLEPIIGVIGNIVPLGICGSGLIDTIAELLKLNIITRAGKFNNKSEEIINHRRVIKKEDGYHYILYREEWDIEQFEASSSDTNIKEISICQKDINQVQLAKAAFLSAANILLEMEDESNESLDQIILAGGFGTYIKKENAAFIGLFPEVDKSKIFQIGNAAGIGAQMFIKDIEQRNIANKIAHDIKYREIATSPLFQKEYTFSLYFPHYDLDKFPKLKQEYDKIPLK